MARIAKQKNVPSGHDVVAGLGRRILRARIESARENNSKVSQADLGRLVGRYLGAEKAVTSATVSRWEAEESVPDLATLGAIAAVCQVDPGWLAFGARSKALGPDAESANPEVDRWKRAHVEILLSQERQLEVALWQRRVGRDWNARFNRNERDRRAARRIKDKTERLAREAAVKTEFERLVLDLNQLTEEATRRYQVAMEIETAAGSGGTSGA